MKPLILVLALVGVEMCYGTERTFPFPVVPQYVLLATANHINHDALAAHTNVIQALHPFFISPSYALRAVQPQFSSNYRPVQGGYKPFVPFAWGGHHETSYQQPINNLPPLPPIPAGYPPLPSIPPPGGPGTIIITPGTPSRPQPPRPMPPPPPPPVIPVQPSTTPRPVIPVTQPRPQPIPVVSPTTSRPVIPVTVPPARPVTRPPRPIVIPTTPQSQTPRPVDDDDDVADPISNPPVLSADRNPTFHYLVNTGADNADILVDPAHVIDIKGIRN
ncbi:hypothetical protein BIW11_06615 [Tropilaelaps mercedesae]|uniref:Uncharacterized protein n=1 Tax=Tropilaelaps mercedesae TaxID=418985 RepID=A0A1V9XXA2_9ACAR|nr:hypothetical protein BIW11_06615 [Tropilaelaps mercedesae]